MVGGGQRSLKGEDCFATRQQEIGGDFTSWILVADGHGGKQVSSYISSRVLEHICITAADGSADALNKAAVSAFREMHSMVCDVNFDAGETKAGSTLTVCCINATRGELHTWNVGDSLALLVHDGGYVEMGQTHRLEESPEEQERVQGKHAALGRAIGPDGQAGGPIRAFPGGLAVTRGIGDSDCAFVTPRPAFVTRPVPRDGGALLACSDGVWDHLSSEEAAAVLLEGNYHDGRTAALRVADKAVKKVGITDDTTVCVMLFGPQPVVAATPTTQKERHGSFLRHMRPRGTVDDCSEDGASFQHPNSVLSAAGEGVVDERDVVFASPVPTRMIQAGESVKAGRVFAPRDFGGGGGDDDDDDERIAANLRPPAWAAVDAAETDAAKKRQSVRIGSSAHFSPFAKAADAASKRDSPLMLRSKGKGASRHSLSKLFDHVVGGKSREDMDGSKSSDMDGSKCSEMDGSKMSDSRSPPWSGVPVNARRVVNADPNYAWRSSSDLGVDGGGGGGGGGGGQGKLRPRVASGGGTLRAQESSLRGSLTTNGQLPESAKSVEWAALSQQMVFLGQGEFATAHRTVLDGKVIAVKMLKKAKQDLPNALLGIKREIMLMTLMKHPNVLPAHALGQHEGKPFIVIELLQSVLDKELPHDPDSVPFWVAWKEKRAWPLSRSLSCGVQLARALKYCHDDAFPGYRILHRDVKPNNIGFLANGQLVLFDFGLASLWRKGTPEVDDDAPRQLTGETGSMRYMAPEVANSQLYNHKAEVYSFASVLWELCAHKKPFFEFVAPEQFKVAIGKGFHPQIHRKWPKDLQTIFHSCWELEHAKRPELRELLPQLETLQAAALVEEADRKAAGGGLGCCAAPPRQPSPPPSPRTNAAASGSTVLNAGVGLPPPTPPQPSGPLQA